MVVYCYYRYGYFSGCVVDIRRIVSYSSCYRILEFVGRFFW